MSVNTMLTCDRCGYAEVANLRSSANWPHPDAELPEGWIVFQRKTGASIEHCCPDCLTVTRFLT